jgi:ElaB/YqjD/DUF883 family membrane-anchored ribosome-binding protein
MADENQKNYGSAIPSQVEEKANRGATHARKATEDLGSAAGAMAEEYRGRAETAWNDALSRVRDLQDDSEKYVRANPTKAVFTALGIGFVLGMIFRR